MKAPLLLLFFLVLAKPLLATFYKGTIGKRKVYAELTVDEADAGTIIYGNYFYESTCRDIPMQGRPEGDKYLITAGITNPHMEEAELFTLVKAGKILRGSREYKGEKLDVVLREFDPADVVNKYMRNPFVSDQELSEIDLLRSSFAIFEKTDSVTRMENNIELTWHKEKHWDSYLFRVTKGLPDSTMQWVNQLLESQQLFWFCGYGRCASSYGTGDFHAEVHTVFINNDFLSYETTINFNCRGAYTSDNTVSMCANILLKEKEMLRTEDILLFPGGVNYMDGAYAEWVAYRSDVYAVRVIDYLRKEYPDRFPPEEERETGENGNCDYSDPSIWEQGEVLITQKGLKFGLYPYRNPLYCKDPKWAVIPYELLQEYLNPDYRDALMKLTK